MNNTFGNNIQITLFGESHGSSIGVVLDGLPSGLTVSEDSIRQALLRRRPAGEISTARREQDAFTIESGVFNGKTTGTPLCIRIENSDVRSADYSRVARPGHADITGHIRYGGYEDYRGGGHFSGRITAPLVAAGALFSDALQSKDIVIGTHIQRIADVTDDAFTDKAQAEKLSEMSFPVLSEIAVQQMQEKIISAKQDGDSVGGILETKVFGVAAGIGEPWFDSVESMLSHALFSIPAVKGVEFGDGFKLASLTGSTANDPLQMNQGKIELLSEHNGGILGGITAGGPITYRVAVKPTPTISKIQKTVDLATGQTIEHSFTGRHDPCIVHRAAAVVNAVSALVFFDFLTGAYGRGWWSK